MSELLATLKGLKLHGMATAYAELLAQGNHAAEANDHWMLKHLVQAEEEDRGLRSIRYNCTVPASPCTGIWRASTLTSPRSTAS